MNFAEQVKRYLQHGETTIEPTWTVYFVTEQIQHSMLEP